MTIKKNKLENNQLCGKSIHYFTNNLLVVTGKKKKANQQELPAMSPENKQKTESQNFAPKVQEALWDRGQCLLSLGEGD